MPNSADSSQNIAIVHSAPPAAPAQTGTPPTVVAPATAPAVQPAATDGPQAIPSPTPSTPPDSGADVKADGLGVVTDPPPALPTALPASPAELDDAGLLAMLRGQIPLPEGGLPAAYLNAEQAPAAPAIPAVQAPAVPAQAPVAAPAAPEQVLLPVPKRMNVHPTSREDTEAIDRARAIQQSQPGMSFVDAFRTIVQADTPAAAPAPAPVAPQPPVVSTPAPVVPAPDPGAPLDLSTVDVTRTPTTYEEALLIQTRLADMKDDYDYVDNDRTKHNLLMNKVAAMLPGLIAQQQVAAQQAIEQQAAATAAETAVYDAASEQMELLYPGLRYEGTAMNRAYLHQVALAEANNDTSVLSAAPDVQLTTLVLRAAASLGLKPQPAAAPAPPTVTTPQPPAQHLHASNPALVGPGSMPAPAQNFAALSDAELLAALSNYDHSVQATRGPSIVTGGPMLVG